MHKFILLIVTSKSQLTSSKNVDSGVDSVDFEEVAK